MFWEVWRNVTSATTNWSLGGGSSNGGGSSGANKGLPSSSSSSAHKTRYNRLGNGPPPKSQSQPANLASLHAYSSGSSDSLPGCGGYDDNGESSVGFPSPLASLPLVLEENGGTTRSDLVEIESHFTPNAANGRGVTTTTVRKGSGSSKKNGMKHSFSSFFPFSSCATTTTSSTSSPPPATSGSNANGHGKTGDLDQQQKQASLAMGNGNGSSCWDHVKGEMSTGINSSSNNENDEEEISDLDDEVEHLTCDVCERAFPTLKLLASHQRKKRHYGCLQCDSIFPSREVLECHREQMCHYDYAIDVYDEDEENFFESDDDEHGLRDGDEDCDDEERERLL